MILTVTLNASIDKVYVLSEPIQTGTVMRVSSCQNSAGGKGLNVARVISICKEKVVASGFVGGYQGQYLESLLSKYEMITDFVHTKGETRSCINILTPDGKSTELLEPGSPILENEKSEFLDIYKKLLQQCEVVTLSGSMPKGMDTGFYAKLITMAKIQKKKVILDTSGDLLSKGMEALPTMIKPNSDEIEALLGIEIKNKADLLKASIELYKRGIEMVVVSLGAEGALLICEEGAFQAAPPSINAVNTVGCGDSMVGAFAVALSRDYSKIEGLKYAVAVSAANAMNKETGFYNMEDFNNIYSEVRIEKL